LACGASIYLFRHPVVITKDGMNGGNAGAIASQNGFHQISLSMDPGLRRGDKADGVTMHPGFRHSRWHEILGESLAISFHRCEQRRFQQAVSKTLCILQLRRRRARISY
jgi:hypothetical protein